MHFIEKKAVKNKVHILLVILDTTNDAKVKKRYINQKYWCFFIVKVKIHWKSIVIVLAASLDAIFNI